MNTRREPISPQRGAALIVALIFLIILTLLGTSGAVNNALEERMANNTRDRDLAFQAAEHALGAADVWIKNQTKTALQTAATTTANDGVLNDGQNHANDAAYWLETFTWTGTNRQKPSDSLSGISSQPIYVVERMPQATCPSGSGNCDYYRITARGLGATSDAVVILQAMYAIN